MLNEKLEKRIRHWNAGNLYHITGRGHKDEYNTPSFDVFTAIRKRRLRWLGHILRLPSYRLIQQWVIQEWEWQVQVPGSLYMDTPKHSSISELGLLAQDRDAWGACVNALSTTQQRTQGRWGAPRRSARLATGA